MGTDHGRRIGPRDLVRFEWLEAVALDPRARWVASVVRRIDQDSLSYRSEVLLSDLAGTLRRRLTEGDGTASSLAWSRDGARLAFVWRPRCPEGSWELVLVDVSDGFERRTLATRGAPPTALDWSPDGTRLACVRWTPLDLAEAAPPRLAPTTARTVRRLRYKQDGVGWVPNAYRQIWVVDRLTNTWEAWTAAVRDHGEPRWSWGGDQLACTVTAREQNLPLGYGQIIILNEDGGRQGPLPHGWCGLSASPMWRHDDAALVFVGHDHPPPVHRRRFAHVWELDLATGRRRDLSGAVDAQVGNYAVSDMRPGLTSVTAAWPEGRGPVWYLSTERGAVHVRCVDPNEGVPRSVVTGQGVVFAFSPSADGTLAYGWSSPTVVGDLFVRRAGATRCLLTLNRWLGDFELAVPEEIEVPAPTGATVHAWELRPPGFDAARRYAAIAYVHCSMFSWAFSHEFQCLAAAGFVVQYANQVGTTAGYGQEHALGNYIGSQHRETAEIHACIDHLVARHYVDSARIGVTGGSCGGYLTNWLVGHSDRFAAAVTQRSISNLVSKFGTGDNGPEQATAEGAEPPWIDVRRLWENSPIAHVAAVRTPVLIIHSTEDHRCPLSQAEEWFAALRWHGVPVELVVFEGESHELSRAGRPVHRIERLRRIIGWFNRHMPSPAAYEAFHDTAPAASMQGA